MWCKICRSHPHLTDKTGAFYKCLKNFNPPLFDKHVKSKEHMNVVQAIANKQASWEEMSSRPLTRWRDKLNEEQRQALFNIFLLAFHKAKHTRPMSSYSEDDLLLKRLGVNVGVAYHSCEGDTQIMQSIAHTSAGSYEQSCCLLNFWGCFLMDLRTSHCVCVQQQRVYLGLSWTDWTGCWQNCAGHNKSTCETFPEHRLGWLHNKVCHCVHKQGCCQRRCVQQRSAKTPLTSCGWRLPSAHSVHHAHTGELSKISWSQRSLLWDI